MVFSLEMLQLSCVPERQLLLLKKNKAATVGNIYASWNTESQVDRDKRGHHNALLVLSSDLVYRGALCGRDR